MKPLFLIGYMGCGKSTIARKIARRTGAAVLDTDKMVEEKEKASVADIFRYEGEDRFRELEREVLEKIIADGGEVVVSTGGGLPVWHDNMERMNEAGVTVYLRRSAKQIARRLSPYGRAKRPRISGLADSELIDFMTGDMATREPFYGKASLVVDCDRVSDADLVERILTQLKHK